MTLKASARGRLWQPVKEQLRFRRIVSRLCVPELDALNYPVTPAKIDQPCFASGIDSVPDRNLFIGAIAVMDHNALKLDRSPLDLKLDRAELPVISAYFDFVVVGVSVHIGFAQEYQAAVVLSV